MTANSFSSTYLARDGAPPSTVETRLNIPNAVRPIMADDDRDNEDYSKKPRKKFLGILAQQQQASLAGLVNDDAGKLFDKMLCVQKPNGGSLILFNPDSNKSALELFSDGNVGITIGSKIDDKENIDNILKGAVLAKAANPDGVYAGGDANGTELLMLVKGAELAGVKVKNPPERTLEQVNPELARKMEQEWAVLHHKQEISPTYSSKEADISGLVKTASPLDNTNLSAQGSFARASQSPPATPSPAPAAGQNLQRQTSLQPRFSSRSSAPSLTSSR